MKAYRLSSILMVIITSALLLVSCEKDINKSVDEQTIPEGDYIARSLEFDKIEGWKFGVSLYVEKQLVDDAGGQVELLKKMDALMAKASAYFAVPGINDADGNKFTFFITSINQFSGASKPYMTDSRVADDTSCDIRLVVNPGASKTDVARGWNPYPYLSAGLATDDVYSDEALLELVKVLAMSRGVYDYSQTEVSDYMKNDINGALYCPEDGIFSIGQLSAGWSQYSRDIINAAGDSRVAKCSYEYIPTGLKVQVCNKEGEISRNAKLKFYKVSPGSGTVGTSPAYSGGLTITGNFIFESNPFVNVETHEIYASNYLVEVYENGKSFFTWMPFHVIASQTAKDSSNQVYRIQLPDMDTYIPDGDYVNRSQMYESIPGWKYRVRIYGERNTVNDVGGRIAFMKKIDKLMEDCSKRFCYSGINDEGGNQMHFYMVDFRTFDGLSKTLRYNTDLNDETVDLTIFVRAQQMDGDISGGYLGAPYYNIGHDWSAGGGDIWTGWGIDALVHEMGHFRGIPDLYAEKVESSKNPVNGQSYDSIHDMMNDTYGNRVWSDYSCMIINANAGNGHIVKEHYDFLPKNTRLTVRKKDGSVATGASVEIFPVKPYTYAVSSTATYEFILDSDYFAFPKSPFNYIDSNQASDTYFNNLVKVTYGGKITYVWWPIHEAEYYGGMIGQDYVYTVRLEQ